MAREFAKSFYKSPEWARVRKYVLMRDKYKCQKCGRPADEVHHKEHLSPENIWDVRIIITKFIRFIFYFTFMTYFIIFIIIIFVIFIIFIIIFRTRINI